MFLDTMIAMILSLMLAGLALDHHVTISPIGLLVMYAVMFTANNMFDLTRPRRS